MKFYILGIALGIVIINVVFFNMQIWERMDNER